MSHYAILTSFSFQAAFITSCFLNLTMFLLVAHAVLNCCPYPLPDVCYECVPPFVVPEAILYASVWKVVATGSMLSLPLSL